MKGNHRASCKFFLEPPTETTALTKTTETSIAKPENPTAPTTTIKTIFEATKSKAFSVTKNITISMMEESTR